METLPKDIVSGLVEVEGARHGAHVSSRFQMSSDLFFGAGRLKVSELEQIYQKRTGCNRLSLCIA